MRSSNSHHRSIRSESTLPWTWIIIVGAIIGILILSHFFSSGTNNGNGSNNSLNILPGSGSEVYIKPSSGSPKLIEENENLYTTDSSLSVANGFAEMRSVFIDGFLDKSSELSYREHHTDGEIIEFTRGRLWIESHGNNTLEMKNLTISLKDGDIVLLEQPNQIFSTLYSLKGNVNITAGGYPYLLAAGKKIMVSKSDLANPGTTLDSLSGPIDDSIRSNPLFIMRNGDQYLSSIVSSGSGMETNTGIISSSGSLSGASIENTASNGFIQITSPIDGSTVTTTSIDIYGTLVSKDVKRVTLNDIDAIVSPVDKTFSLKGVAVTNDIMNIVYKAYSSDANLLQKGVLTVYAKNRQNGTDKLTPTNFPLNDKDYKILNPGENPYKTTDGSVTVSGVVPKNTVSYIMVNNFRLKKFVPNSTSWYYYANMDYGTMKDGINLYEISFYDGNNTLLYKQLFTIVKEAKGTISGELLHS